MNSEELIQGIGPMLATLTKGQQALEAMANLYLGATVVPEGIVTISPHFVYIPLIVRVTVPQRLYDALGKRNWEDTGDGLPEQCNRIADPELTKRDYPLSPSIHEQTAQILTKYRQRYKEGLNPYSTLL